MMQALWFVSAISTLTLQAESATNRLTLLPGSTSPDKSLGLFQVVDAQQRISEIRLMSVDGGPVNQSFPLSSGVRTWDTRQTHASVVWSEDGLAVAFGISDGTNGEAYACVQAKDGTLKAVNLAPTARSAHLGVLGRPGTDFSRFEDTPMKWGTWSAHYGRIVIVRTRFWGKGGKRFTVSGPFMVTDKGEVGGQ